MSQIPLVKYPKDSASVLDYVFDFASKTNGTGGLDDYLTTGETISTINSVVVTGPDAALLVDSSALATGNTQIVVWLSAGTTGAVYMITANFSTNQSRTDERSFRLKIKDL